MALPLQDFTIDGQVHADPDDENYKTSYRDILLYVEGNSSRPPIFAQCVFLRFFCRLLLLCSRSSDIYSGFRPIHFRHHCKFTEVPISTRLYALVRRETDEIDTFSSYCSRLHIYLRSTSADRCYKSQRYATTEGTSDDNRRGYSVEIGRYVVNC